jgi:hypothetical protein
MFRGVWCVYIMERLIASRACVRAFSMGIARVTFNSRTRRSCVLHWSLLQQASNMFSCSLPTGFFFVCIPLCGSAGNFNVMACHLQNPLSSCYDRVILLRYLRASLGDTGHREFGIKTGCWSYRAPYMCWMGEVIVDVRWGGARWKRRTLCVSRKCKEVRASGTVLIF